VIVISVLIQSPIDAVWTAISDLASHDQWMADAESIEFAAATTAGVGTRLTVVTRIGPLRTVDMLEVTEWIERRLIAVKHTGTVTGVGRFELTPVAGETRLTWRENLSFPLRWGGPVAGWLARPLLWWIWRGNLRRLKSLVEAGYSPPTA
jgi:carbon monoxide dehydrogenase subunit G